MHSKIDVSIKFRSDACCAQSAAIMKHSIFIIIKPGSFLEVIFQLISNILSKSCKSDDRPSEGNSLAGTALAEREVPRSINRPFGRCYVNRLWSSSAPRVHNYRLGRDSVNLLQLWKR